MGEVTASLSAGGNDLVDRKRDSKWGWPCIGARPGQPGTGGRSVQVPALGNQTFLLVTPVLIEEAQSRPRDRWGHVGGLTQRKHEANAEASGRRELLCCRDSAPLAAREHISDPHVTSG